MGLEMLVQAGGDETENVQVSLLPSQTMKQKLDSSFTRTAS